MSSSIKSLASQTVWYGTSSIAARFLNYLLTPYLTSKLTGPGYGEIVMIYAAMPFLSVIFTYGMETTFFRFSSNKNSSPSLYSTTIFSILISTIVFSSLLFIYQVPIARLLKVEEHPEFFTYTVLIIAFDTISTIPFSKLRLDGKPKKFAFVRILNILTCIFFTYFFISIVPKIAAHYPESFIAHHYIANYGVGYVILANLISSSFTVLLLSKELFAVRFKFDRALWVKMMWYSMPLIIVGFGGVLNETFDRVMLGWWAPVANKEAAMNEVGVYGACYKLSILISLFIQAFRMGAEPFFFKQAEGQNPQKTYARVMKFFVIAVSVMFLMVAMYLDIWKEFIRNKHFWVGLKVVPILLMANIFLGIYYNLSIWYKINHKTIAGAYITIFGAILTIVINYFFIPRYSYMACAWATFFCYGSMMVLSFLWGQKEYFVPYAWRKLLAYLLITVILFSIHQWVITYHHAFITGFVVASILLLLYVSFILKIEKREFEKMPIIGKFFKAGINN